MNLFETGIERYQPDRDYSRGFNPEYIISQRFFASLVGLIAIGLPVVLILASVINNCFYNSISHSYYSRFFGDIFVGSLAMIGIFLLAYRGLNPKENLLATFAGLASFCVALFPTQGSGLENKVCAGRAFYLYDGFSSYERSYELFSGAVYIHLASAGFLFAFLAWYSLFVFTRETKVTADNTDILADRETKRKRNRTYILSGFTIVFCLIALGIFTLFGSEWEFWDAYNITFWLEALALAAFGVSWSVKGRLFGTIYLDQSEAVQLSNYLNLTPQSFFKAVAGFAAFLASILTIGLGFLQLFPPSQAVVAIEKLATFDDEELMNGNNFAIAQFIERNLDKRVFLRLVLPTGTGEIYREKVCGVETIYPAKATKENEYTLIYPEDNRIVYDNEAAFCADVVAKEASNLEEITFNVLASQDEDSCARVTYSSGGILYTQHHITGFFRIQKGESHDRIHYTLRSDIPEGAQYDDTLDKVEGC